MTFPPSITDFAGLAAIAEHLRDARASGDRSQVEAGRITAAVAADRLRIAGALAADWRSIADRKPRPARNATASEVLAMLTQALPAAIARRDRAWKSLVANAPNYRKHASAELWALSEAADVFSEDVRRDIVEYVRPWLNAEAIGAGLAAMHWWQQRGDLPFARAEAVPSLKAA